MNEPVDEGDDASGIGKHLVPFGKGFVRGQDHAAAQLVAPGNDLEEEVQTFSPLQAQPRAFARAATTWRYRPAPHPWAAARIWRISA